ncbi:Gaa1-like protein [Dipodascopsis uninucleata]
MQIVDKVNRLARRNEKFKKLKLTSVLITLSSILIIGGIGWLFYLPVEGQSRRTYISENALLPGQALTYFEKSEENIVRAFREEIRLLADKSQALRTETIREWIDIIGFKSASHNWTFSHYNDIKSGSNAYGVLHAPRGDTTESMIICAPWLNEDGVVNEGGVAIALSLSRYLKRWSIWSKDIILLIPSDGGFGLSAWVSDYHQTSMLSSGAIEGGIILDFPGTSDRFDVLEILYSGKNGQLPNLDLVNTLVLIAGYMGVKVTVNGIDMPEETYHSRTLTLLSGIAHQALSNLYKAGAGHEAFSGWRIDTVTMRANTGFGPYDQMLYGRIVEAGLRSINNLLEHFHQSFFFYLLLSPRRFVSIGTYLPSAMMVGASFTIKGFYLWLSSENIFSEVLNAAIFYGTIVLGSFICFAIAAFIPTESLVTFFYTSAVLLGTLPVTIRTLMEPKSASFIQKFQSYAFVATGMFLSTLATLNFSLSLIMGLLLVPLAQFVYPLDSSGFLRNIISFISIIITCPSFVILVSHYFFVKESFADFVTGAMWCWRGQGVWSFIPLVFCVWQVFWIVCCLALFIPVKKKKMIEMINDTKERVACEGRIRER